MLESETEFYFYPVFKPMPPNSICDGLVPNSVDPSKTFCVDSWKCKKDNTTAWTLNLAGDGCDDINECIDVTTTHNCHADAFCTNNEGSFVCTCNPTYSGKIEISSWSLKKRPKLDVL